MITLNEIVKDIAESRTLTLMDIYRYLGGSENLWDAYCDDRLDRDLVDWIDNVITPQQRSIKQNIRMMREIRALVAEVRRLANEIKSNIGPDKNT